MKKKNIGLAIVLLAILGLVVQAADVTTAVISSADTGILNTSGSDAYVYLCGGAGYGYSMGYVRFDLSGINIDTIVSASLKMTVSGGAPHNDTVTTGRYALHGLYDIAGNTPQNWNEATLNQSNTGAEVNWTAGTLDMARVIDLDSGANSGIPGTNGITETLVPGGTGSPLNGDWARGTTLTTTGAPLVTFLNSRVADNSLVTFIINPEVTNDRGYGLVSREEITDLTYRPELTLTYTPGGAYAPFPADDSTVDVNFYNGIYLRRLSWTQATGTTKWDVYFGTGDPNSANYKTVLTKVQSGTKRYYNIPTTLISGTTYSWVVDSYKGTPLPPEPNCLGVIWKFTASALPIFTTQPAMQAKLPGETAVFTAIAGSSIVPITYSWYRSTDTVKNPAGDTPVGTDSTTLTLPGVTSTDEGYYYCVATNSAGSSYSNTAHLVLKRLYAHWALDGNANDSSGNALHGTLFGAPVFDAGVNGTTGQAMVFDGVDDYIAEPNSPGSFSDFSAGITISVWAKPTAAGTFARFIDFGTGAPGDNIFFTRSGTASDLQLGVNIGAGGSATVTATGVIVLNEWQMFVATVDESRNVVLYKNGLPVGTGTTTTTIPQMPTIITRTRNYIGRSNWTADAMYAGLMDDIYIYNYARTADNVATAYSDVAGDFCRTKPAYDWDNNCKVDLGDIRIFATTWLECGLFPVCP